MSFSESSDGKSIIFGDREVSRELLDAILELGSIYEIQELLNYHRATKTHTIEDHSIEDLVGVDLSGKVLRFWFSNWEDSEWIYGDGVLTVESTGDSFRLVAHPLVEALLESEDDDSYEQARRAVEEAGFSYSSHTLLFQLNLTLGDSIQVLTPKS